MMFGYDEDVAMDWNRNDRIGCNFLFTLCFLQYKFNDGILENIPTYREAYHDVLEICVNKELNDTYGLVAHTEILSCDKSTDEVVIGKR